MEHALPSLKEIFIWNYAKQDRQCTYNLNWDAVEKQ